MKFYVVKWQYFAYRSSCGESVKAQRDAAYFASKSDAEAFVQEFGHRNPKRRYKYEEDFFYDECDEPQYEDGEWRPTPPDVLTIEEVIMIPSGATPAAARKIIKRYDPNALNWLERYPLTDGKEDNPSNP